MFFTGPLRGDLAAKLGLNGWARNLYDGRVEALFEGSRELIEQAIQECWKGPAGSSVSNIDVQLGRILCRI